MTNGTSATAIRFAQELRKRGHQVKLLGVGPVSDEVKKNLDDPDYIKFDKWNFPCFEWLVEKEGFMFAKKDDKKMVDAIKDADVVHLFLPFGFENRARRIAQALGVTVTGAFHLQPDTITYTIYMQKLGFVTSAIYRGFYSYFYKKISEVHCPSEMIADQLVKRHYDNCKFTVISNGVSSYFHPVEAKKPEELKNKFIVLMVGRLSREKRQDIIIRAIGKSKHNDNIQLILCGQGPNEKSVRKLAGKKLKNPVIIKFISREELRKVLCYSDLYIHASDAEIEGISCIEAIACGMVPVISDSPISATNRYAIDKEHCIFHRNDSKDLASKIDYFYENPEKREELSKEYIEYAKKFELSNEVARFETFLSNAINEHKEGKDVFSQGLCKKDIRKTKKTYKQIKKYL